MRNYINTNIYSANITEIANSSIAWDMGCEIFCTTHDGRFYLTDRSVLISFLRKAAELQDENGFVALFKDAAMPGDARADIVCKPSYAITAIAIYAYMNYREDFDSSLTAFLKKLMNIYEKGIHGHGYEAAETVCETMEMLSNSTVLNFILENPELCKKLENTICTVILYYTYAIKEYGAVRIGFEGKDVTERVQCILDFWADKKTPIFVYGTLMQGEPAHSLIDSARFGGKFILKNCAMYNLGAYPGIKQKENENVIGELYYIDNEDLDKIDKYEGEGSLYKRRMITVSDKVSTVSCYAYFYCGDVNESKIMRTRWNEKDDEYVWYACYGSNLSAKRFECYIKGGMCKENGVSYAGCSDKSLWTDSKVEYFNGQVYFGNQSPSWSNKGVAFFDENGCSRVIMRLYKITYRQLNEIQLQEGASPSWYGKKVFLGIDSDGCEIYTLTSEKIRPKNEPSAAYTALIEAALTKELGMKKRNASYCIEQYLNNSKEN